MLNFFRKKQKREIKAHVSLGTKKPIYLTITKHAIDRASYRLINDWHNQRYYKEGLASWLLRKTVTLLDKHEYAEQITEDGITFQFSKTPKGGIVLTTVYEEERFE